MDGEVENDTGVCMSVCARASSCARANDVVEICQPRVPCADHCHGDGHHDRRQGGASRPAKTQTQKQI